MKKVTTLLAVIAIIASSCSNRNARYKLRSPNGWTGNVGIGTYSPGFNYNEPNNGGFEITDVGTEDYDLIVENEFLEAMANPVSTFSVDVDRASYANARRFINSGSLPPPDAVRIEEMINYFNYDYPQPTGDDPFSFTSEVSECPWNKTHKLVHIGLQGKRIEFSQEAPSNLVFLVDVSGSMGAANKLPLLKSSFDLLLNNLKPDDMVSIVVYAGAAGVVLQPTKASEKKTITKALKKLKASGSTAGGEGIIKAYQLAKENLMEGGNNRVILATDGDFNIGPSSDADMIRLIEEKRKEGIFLTVLGFGMGNYKDSKMEKISNAGNGNYAYIDNLMEAKKVLVDEIGSTLVTIAKDVKIQVEFNPTLVKSYRLIGYENRMLKKEDFEDDTKDAGEIGAGHTVTALYEIVSATAEDVKEGIDQYKYQTVQLKEEAFNSKEMATIRFRYKQPDGEVSKEIVNTIEDKNTTLDKSSNNFRFSASVAEFGLLLRNSEYKGEACYEQVLEMAKASSGEDKFGYRRDFVSLVDLAKNITPVGDKDEVDGVSFR